MFIPIHIKSNFSLLSSVLKIDDIIQYSIENHLSSCFLTDTNMYGAMEFFLKCQKKNLNPILGLEVDVSGHKYLVYAKNYQGYQSLIKLSTLQNEGNLSLEDFKKYHQELILIVLDYDPDLDQELCKIYEDFYLGYQNKQEEKKVFEITSNIVFVRECLYLSPEDADILNYLYRIRDNRTFSDDVSYDTLNKSLKSFNLSDFTDNMGINNIEKIIQKCKLEFPKPKLLLPIYETKDQLDASTYLFELSKVGLKKRLNNKVPKEYQDRLQYELQIIDKMGFSNYFLVVYDFIKYAKQNKILVGPGRGSAAGSLVSYSLGITDIDPLKYDLLFERFLNPERVTMPDIDTDFPDQRRGEVIDYVTKKYGKKRVAGIVTFGTMGAKQVLRDVARVMSIPAYKVDALSKFIPAFSKEKLTDFYRENPYFKSKIESDHQLKKLFSIALKIEGFPRHTSSHAAGIVMCQKDLDEVLPLTVSEGMYLTSYSMEYLEDLGLLKMDFLGLKNLTLISHVLEDISSLEKLDFNQIPLEDNQVLKLFQEADTTGIFQFESTGMRAFLKRLHPTSFEDIFAAIALFRPGPSENIDSYIRRKHGEEKITYLDPCLEKILKNTYGIIIYQEQIMQVASTFAGYSLGEADILRRAMSKKKVDLLQAEEEKFLKKSVERGHSLEKAKEIFALILKFAGYGFNRSHSVAYSIIAFKMAYLKVHYCQFFFSNLLTNVIGSESKTKEYLVEARSKNISIEKPNLNLSTDRYRVVDGKIIYPFSNIKQVGAVATKSILKAREQGNFQDIYDAFSRLVLEGVTKKTLESLILADAFRLFPYNKKTLILNLDELMNYAELTKDLDPSLVMKPELKETEEYTSSEELEHELEIFGFYFSHHPTMLYQKKYPGWVPLRDISKYFSKTITTLVVIDRIHVIHTKKGDKMAFLTGSDETMSMNYTLFPKIFQQYSDLSTGEVVRIVGVVEKRLNEYQIIVNQIEVVSKGEENEER